MDRNAKALDEFKQAKARQQFAQALAAGTTAPLDRFANPIKAGSLMLWHLPHDMVWEVKDVSPVLDPRVPPGVVRLKLECILPCDVVAGNVNIGMVVVGRQNAPGHAQLDTSVMTEQSAEVAPDGNVEGQTPDSEPEPEG